MQTKTTHVEHFQKNTQGRDFVVGDIHGMFSTLEKLLNEVSFNDKLDRIFSVGDLIDRGYESERIIEFLTKPWFFSIMGNHERMLLDAKNSKIHYRNWVKYNRGEWWETVTANQKQDIQKKIEKLPLVADIVTSSGLVGIVHADIPTQLSWQTLVKEVETNKPLQQYILWSKARYERYKTLGSSEIIDEISRVICGHTTLSKYVNIGNLYYIDTGASYIKDKSLGRLTMMQIQPELAFFQVKTDKRRSWFGI